MPLRSLTLGLVWVPSWKLSRRRDLQKFMMLQGKLYSRFLKLLMCSEIKEMIKETKDEKKTKKVEVMTKTSKTQRKANISKGVVPKGPKIGGGGGKH
ncbi:hypothetical protein FNV43_RR16975 [Rhamnella rubrinervis]|uniref:Uncharacterized protein n=1 Tax=Rhamnella rubrinervis TaxID=2594499 RepID=A0A8K0GZR9_9ROSA|nr:hypothetical protein FNV43_RR16975 [Rhamnella rubrinervis]